MAARVLPVEVRAGFLLSPVVEIGSVAFLCDRHADWAWQGQATATYEALKRAQSFAYTHVVREDLADFDPNTSAYPKIYKCAARATGAAVEIACKTLRGNR